MFDVEVEQAWLADTERWNNFHQEGFHIVDDEEIPDWLEEERYEECFGIR